jgi:hypothetical protein
MKIGDMCILTDIYPAIMGTIIREIPHPYLDFKKAYYVLDVNGKKHKVSEDFVKPVV